MFQGLEQALTAKLSPMQLRITCLSIVALALSVSGIQPSTDACVADGHRCHVLAQPCCPGLRCAPFGFGVGLRWFMHLSVGSSIYRTMVSAKTSSANGITMDALEVAIAAAVYALPVSPRPTQVFTAL